MVQLNELMGNRKLWDVFQLLLNNPSTTFTYTQLRQKTKLAKATLTKWLLFLVHFELVNLQTLGRNKLYQVNAKHSLVHQFKKLNTLIQLEPLTKYFHKKSLSVYMFGSAARGEDTEESDIDLLILGKIYKEEVMGEVQRTSKKIRKKISLQIFSLQQWAEAAQKDKTFYERVEKDKVILQ